MASPSKEEDFLWAIFGHSPLRHWHFGELLNETGMSRAALNKWLKRHVKEGMLRRVKEGGRFPYFTAGPDNPMYKAKKRQFFLDKLYESGLITDILRFEAIKVAIVFGSVARGDWYMDSDIDLFVFGDAKDLDKRKYGLKLDIEVQEFGSREELREVKTGLVNGIVNGYLIKGDIGIFAEVIV